MANRRMFSKNVVRNDLFLDMPTSARLLYYDLGVDADDDGFVSPKMVMRMTGASDDDLKILVAKRLVIPFEDGVVVIRDWKVNNDIRWDRYTETRYVEHKAQLILINGQYDNVNSGGTNGTTIGMTQDRLGKVRLGKVSLEEREKNHTQMEWLIAIDKDTEKEFLEKFDCTKKQLTNKGEQFYSYCKSKGRLYKDYKHALRNALDKDFGRKKTWEEQVKEEIPDVKIY